MTDLQRSGPTGSASHRLKCAVSLFAVWALIALPGQASAAPPTTVAVGDSITNGARPAIMKRFADEGWSGGVNAHPGSGVKGLRPVLQYIAKYTPSLKRVFLFAGTNDALAVARGASLVLAKNHLGGAVHDVIDKRPRACVFLVTLNLESNVWVDPPPGYGTDLTRLLFMQAVHTLNTHMVALAQKYSKVHLIDWDRVTNDHDGGPGEDDWMIDNIHPDFAPGGKQGPGHWGLADRYRNWGRVASGCGTTLP